MAQPPELTGGGGFTFEDTAVAIYLAALLGEETAPGLAGRAITKVALQQSQFGEPLDDLIVDGRAPDGTLARLSLQVKRALTISAAKSNVDFREIVLNAWATLEKPDFREDVDRVGAVTGTISEETRRALDEVCEWARKSTTPETFFQRFSVKGSAGAQRQAVLKAFQKLLATNSPQPVDDAGVFRLLRHFVLIRIDVLHDGSTDEPNAISRLRPALHPQDAGRADDLWHRLRTMARDAAGRAGEFNRPSLLNEFHGAFRFSGASSLRMATERIHAESALALANIPSQIDGVGIQRPALDKKLEASLKQHRFVQIVGLPGTGKSAVLRALAEEHLANGTVFFLKTDRLSGPNWAVYAQSAGIAPVGIEVLLAEISATGTPILFIDGIDRVEPSNRGILLDLVNTILQSSVLASWRVVATSRDNGIEPLRTWLPTELFRDGGVGTVEVTPFNDEEAELLADAKPSLRPLLFGDERVSEIARRPFFAAVLARSLATGGSSVPRSEVELINVWWLGGGYAAEDPRRAYRQRTLIQLAKMSAATLGRPIRIEGIDLNALSELKTDGILRDAPAGHSVQFTHDIFFEWSFIHFLIDQGEAWPEQIRALGEPPILGRAVELLSQHEFLGGDKWERHLAVLEASSMRPQWLRCWLLAPFGVPTFPDRSADFTKAVFRDGTRRLANLAVWFQADKTKANPIILARSTAGDEQSRRETIRLADALAWPSDWASWGRFCTWFLANIAQCPAGIIPDVVSAFEVWQNMLAGYRNAISPAIIERVQTWLEDIEDRQHPEKFKYDYGTWKSLSRAEIGELESSLRSLLLRSSQVEINRVRDYLRRVQGRRHLRHEAFSQIIMFAPFLSAKHGKELAALTLAELKDDLPLDIAKRPRARGEFPRSFSYHDWNSLAIRDSGAHFFPAAPKREPFYSLLQHSPVEGQELVRVLANHAITAWRQLFTLDPQRRGTPRPVTIEFPWGRQDFWGDAHVYMWTRGQWGPHPVETGLMALEDWAFGQLEGGRDVDEVTRDVVAGHESCAVLEIAVALALTSQRVSETTVPILTSQRLWDYDLQRFVGERSGLASTIGFTRQTDREHYQAVQANNARTARRIDIRSLASLAVIYSDEKLRTAAQTAIQAFPMNLPFAFDEEAKDDRAVKERKRTAEIWSELGKLENYVAERAKDGKGIYIKVENPTAADPDVVAIVQRSKRMNDQAGLLLWIDDSLKRRTISDQMVLADAIKRAKNLDAPALFIEGHGKINDDDMDRGAVAGVAAVALLFSDALAAPDQSWAADVIFRASVTPVHRGDLWSAQSMAFHHPCLYAVSGLEALIRRGVEGQKARQAMLVLAGHPLEQISYTAIETALSCWDIDPAFAWCGLNLGLKLSVGEIGDHLPSAYGYDHDTTPSRISEAVASSVAELNSSRPRVSLEPLPEAWVLAPRPRMRRPFEDDEDNEDSRKPVWREPDKFLRWDFLPKFLNHIPVGLVLADELRRPAFLSFCYQLVAWTIERLLPSWRDAESDRHDQQANELHEWRASLFGFLAKIALDLDVAEVQRHILDPVFKLDDKLADSMISPFIDLVICMGILDADHISAQAIRLVELCVKRILTDTAWENARDRDGDIYGFDLPNIISILLMVKIDRADKAARFVNGDWRDIEAVFSIIDPFVREVGDIASVMFSFLKLCERAIEHYPAEAFAAQITVMLNKQQGTPIGWRHTSIPSRIAALVHAFAEKSRPLAPSLAQSMLRILDRLVDVGDRRSAALQTSELFRDVRLTRSEGRS